MASQKALRELNTSPTAMRSPSLSSDVPSTRSAARPAIPEAVPSPAFVASAEASQLVSSEVDDSVSVKEQALALLNSFLDQILYNFISTARSVQLGRLRDAVPVVLKPRLGKAALNAADEELKEYLNEGDDDMLRGSDLMSELTPEFDLELAWKLARLRCMVYTRLGDMEEEDEEEYIESEDLHPGSGTYTDAAYRASTIKAASAIFLTSILEYLGEQALLYAVQNTQRRAQAPQSPVALQLDENGPMSPPIHQSMVLEEVDMFYVGRESPLSRLWRSWRRQTRPPMETLSRQISPIPHAVSNDNSPTTERASQMVENPSQEDLQRTGSPHQIPLPISENDVNEIEVPGLAREIVDDEDSLPIIPVPERSKKRPVSMVINKSDIAYQPSTGSSQTGMTIKQKRLSRPNLGHMRSMSHPVPEKKRFSAPGNGNVEGLTPTEITEEADGLGVGLSEPNVMTDQESSVKQPKEKPQLKEGYSSAGIVAAAASAVGGALGLGALASATRSTDHSNEAIADEQPRNTRTAADEMLGTKPSVAPPKDAVTGSSIISVGDFDNLHVPVEEPKASEDSRTISRLDSSDPEDLALSSGDEDASGRRRDAPVTADSSLLSNDDSNEVSARTQSLDAAKTALPENANFEEPENNASSTNGQGMTIPTSEASSKRDSSLNGHDEPDRLLYAPPGNGRTAATVSRHQSVTTPLTDPSGAGSATSRSILSPTYAQPGQDTIRESVASRPSTATTTIQSSVPPRVSSDRSARVHVHTDSRTSQYSRDSQRSSSSSRLLGFTRDDEGRPQTGTPYEPLMNSTQTYSYGSPNKLPLRVETNAGREREREINQAEATKKSLEILIRGDETLHYTLTPVSARAENFPSSAHSFGWEAGAADVPRNLSSRGGTGASHKASNSSTNINGLRSNPVGRVAASPASQSRDTTRESLAGGSAPSTGSPARARNNRAQPRDARLENTTMMDLADYARSTGPETEQQLPRALSARPGTSGTAKTVKSTSNTVRTMPAPPVPVTRPSTVQSQGAKRVGAHTRFEAREATVPRRSGTDDLIEFLREGPPSSPGHVNGYLPNDNGRASAASTQTSSVAPRSIQESMNSSTALLASNRAQSKKVNGVHPSTPAAVRQAPQSQRDATPARKQQRVRDPYAIDDSDDEMDEEQGPSQTRKTQDESLIDFLRNTQPHPGSSPPPILGGSSVSAAAGVVKRQSSTQGIRERIMRSASRSSLNRKASVNNSRPAPTNDDNPPQYYRSTGTARETSPHLVQTGKKIDSYKPTSVTHAPHIDRNRAQKFAQAPISSRRTETADLADYLKNSGPPDTPARRRSSVKEEAGFLKFFARRKAMK